MIVAVTTEELRRERESRPLPIECVNTSDYMERMAAHRDKQTRLLLRLLMSGKTRDSAAKALGISPRHATRLIASYSDKHNIRGPYQVAVHALLTGFVR